MVPHQPPMVCGAQGMLLMFFYSLLIQILPNFRNREASEEAT